MQGNLTQIGGTVGFEIAGTESGEADLLAVSGTLALPAGAVHVDLVDGFLPEVGDEVLLATGDPISLDPAGAPSLSGAAPGFEFEVVVAPAGVVLRALTAAEGFGACQVAQLKAFSKLCKKLFDCGAGYAKKPAKDPGGAKREDCRGKGEESFAKAYDKAAAKAASKGELCGLTASAAEAAGAVREPADLLAGEILTGWNPAANGDDDTLRSALLKETGRLCGSDLGGQSQNAKKRDLAKRDSARAKARASFDSKTAKAFEKADQAGVVYTGRTAGPSPTRRARSRATPRAGAPASRPERARRQERRACPRGSPSWSSASSEAWRRACSAWAAASSSCRRSSTARASPSTWRRARASPSCSRRSASPPPSSTTATGTSTCGPP